MNYSQFRDYVMSQPTDRPINHSKGWCGCAIGDAYFHHHPNKVPEEDFAYAVFPGCPENILETWRYDERIPPYAVLDENGRVLRGQNPRWTGPERLTTYGHLQDYIKYLEL